MSGEMSNLKREIGGRDNTIEELENEIIQLNESKDNCENEMLQQAAKCLVYFDKNNIFFQTRFAIHNNI